MSPSDRRWVSCREFGELYHLHPKTVLLLCRQRRIPFTRLPSIRGGRGGIRVDIQKFEEMLAVGEILPASAPLDRRRR